jgi:hydrogenase/urease accessory protein HupE
VNRRVRNRGRAAPPFRGVAWLFVALFLAQAGAALAHVGGTTGFATVSVHGGTVRYSLTLSADALGAAGVARPPDMRLPQSPDDDALARLVAGKVEISADGRRCEPVPGTVTPPSPDRANVVIIVHYACAGTVRELALHDRLSDAFGGDYHTLVKFEGPSGSQQHLFEPERREARFVVAASSGTAPPAPSSPSGVLAFFRLGIEHILSGFDHLLFVFALILRGGSIASVLAIVTAFTVAHSVTLALAVLHVMSVPAWLVEPVIALSIVYVAAENIFSERAISRRWAVSFIFGLVHGFGFAGALLELELPTGSLVGSLLSFNLGVEAGQAMVIAVLWPALMWLRRFDWEPRAATTLSALVLTAGLALLIERALFPLD